MNRPSSKFGTEELLLSSSSTARKLCFGLKAPKIVSVSILKLPLSELGYVLGSGIFRFLTTRIGNFYFEGLYILRNLRWCGCFFRLGSAQKVPPLTKSNFLLAKNCARNKRIRLL